MRKKLGNKEAKVTARVPLTLKGLMRKFVERDTHLNESDFIRDAIREKIKREAPNLIQDLLQSDSLDVSNHEEKKGKLKCKKCGEELTYNPFDDAFKALDFIIKHLLLCYDFFEVGEKEV